MRKSLSPLLVLTASLFLFACTKDSTLPEVVSTLPASGAEEVDSSITELKVTFSEPMRGDSWSWNYEDEGKFPLLSGDPFYDEDGTVNTLPVQLEPGKTYEIWLNSEENQNFKDEAGNPLEPYHWTFTTK